MAETAARRALRDWILAAVAGRVQPEELDDTTPIIERRIITSLQIMDLVLFLEQLRGRPIDVSRLQVGVFKSIDAIVSNFLAGDDHGG